MGETLGIAHNVFEKVAREKDRKERMTKYDDWQKQKIKKQQKIAGMHAKLKESTNNGSLANVAVPEDLDDPAYSDEEGGLEFAPPDADENETAVASPESKPRTPIKLTNNQSTGSEAAVSISAAATTTKELKSTSTVSDVDDSSNNKNQDVSSSEQSSLCGCVQCIIL
jgi:hypothetical protein